MTDTAQQSTAADSVEAEHSPDVNVNRPKRSNRGQPMYDQTKRRKTASKEGEGKSAVVANKADGGSGRGRVTLAQTVVVGRVYIQRMERTGMDRRDAGRPPREPG